MTNRYRHFPFGTVALGILLGVLPFGVSAQEAESARTGPKVTRISDLFLDGGASGDKKTSDTTVETSPMPTPKPIARPKIRKPTVEDAFSTSTIRAAAKSANDEPSSLTQLLVSRPTPTRTPTATPTITPTDTPTPEETPRTVIERIDPSMQVDMNTATESDFSRIPGIDSNRARLIVAHRLAIGFFTRPDELMDVFGISESIYKKALPYLKVNALAPVRPVSPAEVDLQSAVPDDPTSHGETLFSLPTPQP
jgi:DNA uptake protein ComE-like DNA-binding protein